MLIKEGNTGNKSESMIYHLNQDSAQTEMGYCQLLGQKTNYYCQLLGPVSGKQGFRATLPERSFNYHHRRQHRFQ